MTTTVRQLAEQLELVPVIERAMSYESGKFPTLWLVPVEYDFRLKTTAGNANRSRIKLHPGLLQAEPREHIGTFLHELAHVMDCCVRGHSGHDYPWQEMMIRLGEKPIRTHNISACRKRVEKGQVLDLDL
jgi:predicted SprT family Zn-dependent metalloprotease